MVEITERAMIYNIINKLVLYDATVHGVLAARDCNQRSSGTIGGESMSEIFNDLQEAPGIGFPVRLQIKPRRLLVIIIIVTVAIGTPAATAHKIRTPVAGREKVYSSPRSELTALLGGSEHQAQGLRESIQPYSQIPS